MYSITQRSAKLKSGKSSIVLLVYGPISQNNQHRGQKIITLKTPPCFSHEWNKEFSRYRKSVENFKVYNNALKAIEDRCSIILAELQVSGNIPTVEEFVHKYWAQVRPSATKNITCRLLWQKYIDALKEESRISTARTMKESLGAWIKFEDQEIGKALPAASVSLDYLMKFTKYLQSNGNAPNTIGIRMRDLRTIYNYGRKGKFLPKNIEYPFRYYNWKDTKGKVQPHEFLTREEWQNFKSVHLENADLIFARDIFIFMVHCFGINFRDLVTLTYSENVRGGVIRFIRKKTRSKVVDKINVYINEEMKEIMGKYNGGNDKIFNLMPKYPVDSSKWQDTYKRTLKKFNKNLGIIALAAGINKNKKITSYVARHTFATLLYFENVPIQVISQSLGHTTESETKNYLRKIDAERVHEITKNIL